MKPDIAVYAMHKPESNVKIFKELSKNLPDGRFFFLFFFGRDSSLARSIVNIQIFTHFKIFFFPFNDALAEWAKNYTLL